MRAYHHQLDGCAWTQELVESYQTLFPLGQRSWQVELPTGCLPKYMISTRDNAHYTNLYVLNLGGMLGLCSRNETSGNACAQLCGLLSIGATETGLICFDGGPPVQESFGGCREPIACQGTFTKNSHIRPSLDECQTSLSIKNFRGISGL